MSIPQSPTSRECRGPPGAAARAAALIGLGTAVLCTALGSTIVLRTMDTARYDRLANNLLHNGALSSCTSAPYLPEFERMPGYPVFLAVIRALGGESNHLV